MAVHIKKREFSTFFSEKIKNVEKVQSVDK
jgi:hypothetical protein